MRGKRGVAGSLTLAGVFGVMPVITVSGQPIRRTWLAQYVNPLNTGDVGSQGVLDSEGNIIVAGWTELTTSDYDVQVVKFSPAGKVVWVSGYTGPGGGYDQGFYIKIDAQDNIIVIGPSIGDGTDYDLLTLKFAPDGELLWAQRYDGPVSGEDGSFGPLLDVDADGNIYVAGYSEGTSGFDETVVIKYAPEGTETWVRRHAGSFHGNPTSRGYVLEVSDAGSVYVGGDGVGPSGTIDFMTLKYDLDGNLAWERYYNGATDGRDGPYGITTDSADNVYLVGIEDTVAGYDYVTLKYAADGSFQWSATYGGYGFHYGWDVEVDAAHNVYVTGASMTGGGEYDMATIKYNSAGAAQWVQRFRTEWFGEDWGFDLELNENADVYVTGYGWNGYSRGDDAITIKYNTNGALLWSDLFNGEGSGQDYAFSIVFGPADTFFVTGTTLGGSGKTEYFVQRYSEAACLGTETITAANCKARDGGGLLVVKVGGGAPFDAFTVELSSGESKSSVLKANGKGKAKFKNLASGSGVAVAAFGCGAESTFEYSCP